MKATQEELVEKAKQYLADTNAQCWGSYQKWAVELMSGFAFTLFNNEMDKSKEDVFKLYPGSMDEVRKQLIKNDLKELKSMKPIRILPRRRLITLLESLLHGN